MCGGHSGHAPPHFPTALEREEGGGGREERMRVAWAALLSRPLDIRVRV